MGDIDKVTLPRRSPFYIRSGVDACPMQIRLWDRIELQLVSQIHDINDGLQQKEQRKKLPRSPMDVNLSAQFVENAGYVVNKGGLGRFRHGRPPVTLLQFLDKTRVNRATVIDEAVVNLGRPVTPVLLEHAHHRVDSDECGRSN